MLNDLIDKLLMKIALKSAQILDIEFDYILLHCCKFIHI